MREIVADIFAWSWFSEPHGYDFNGYLLRHPAGNLCIDPATPSDEVLKEITRLGVSRILLTNRNHARAANRVRTASSAKTAIHREDAAHARGQGPHPMTPRVFISYRTSDGADKATALARELDALFGDAQVFLDKDDLPAGSRWRDVIAHTLGARPVLLVLVTPQYLDGLDAQGRRRIESPDDPVRNELAAALAAEAHIIPVLCDGVAQTPDASALPPPLDQLAERTWRRLRAYDWKQDVARLAADLRALSIEARADAPATAVRPAGDAPLAPAPRRRAVVFGLGGLALLTAAGGGWWWWQAQRNATRLSGTWTAMIAPRGAPTVRDAERLQFRIEHDGDRLRLTSMPVEIDQDPAWAEYRKFWRERTGQDLRRVVYRGEGTVRFDPGAPGSIDVAVRIETQRGEGQIDGGNLQAAVGEAGRRMTGRLWLNSEQAERVVELRRAR